MSPFYLINSNLNNIRHISVIILKVDIFNYLYLDCL